MPKARLAAIAASVAALITLAICAVGQATSADLRLRISRWATDARMIRPPVELRAVKAGQEVAVGDRLITGKAPIEVLAGDIGRERIKPNSAVTYVSARPKVFQFRRAAEVIREMPEGQILIRVSALAAQTRYQVRCLGTATAPRGTAFSVAVRDDRATIVVAQGEVEVRSESEPARVKVVRTRQRLSYGADFAGEPAPVEPADEPLIRELLSLSVGELGGYREPADPSPEDAERFVGADVSAPAQVLGADGDYVTEFRPNTLVLTGPDQLARVGADRRPQPIARGLYFEDITPDGRTILASRRTGGLFTLRPDGSELKEVSPLPFGSARISPNGRTIVAGTGWEEVVEREFDEKTRTSRIRRRRWASRPKRFYVLDAQGAQATPITAPLAYAAAARVRWVQPGDRAVGAIVPRMDNVRTAAERARQPAPLFFHGAPGDARILAEGRFEYRPFLNFTPRGEWFLLPPADGKQGVLRTRDGQRFDLATDDWAEVLPGEARFLVKRGDTRRLIDPASGADADVPSELARYPGRAADEPEFVLAFAPQDGLLAFMDADKLIAVADAKTASRRSVIGIPVPDTYEVVWASGNTVLFRYVEPTRGRNGVQVGRPRDVLVRAAVKLPLSPSSRP